MADDPITKDLDELHKQARGARRLFEPEWFMCLAFFQNRQWLKFAGDRLQQPELSGNRIAVVENLITGIIRTELAKMTKNRPVFTVTPNTGDEEDANASELAERLMRYMWRHLKMHEHSLKALEWSRVCGAGFLKCYWDSTVGDKQTVLVGPDGKIMADSDGKAVRGDDPVAQLLAQSTGAKAKTIAQGDVRVEVRSPFQMFVDPICDSFPDAEWLIEESIKSTEYVFRRYGVKLKADTPANPGLVEARMMGSGPSGSGGYRGVRLREYWSKPSSKYPQGCRIVWAQGQVLDRDDKPFDPMPYVMLTGVPVPGRLWPMSVVELLRGPQTELNKVRSQMAENRNRIGNPTVLASMQATGDAEKFESSLSIPGGVHYFDFGYGPVNQQIAYLEAPQLPEYVADEPQRIQQVIESISGQHEVTNANVPPGVTAASAITLLQEADDTRLGLAMQDYEEQTGRFGEKILKLAAHFYTDARTIKIGGGDDAWEIFDFKGAMLNGNTTVEVQAGSAFPQSQAAKQAQLTDWLRMMAQMGHALDPRQIAQYLRDSGMGATDRLVAEYSDTENQVNRENSLMSLGSDLGINDYDDDQGHIDGHESFQRQARYASFSPQVKQIVEMHVAAHRARLNQTQQQSLHTQMVMAGTIPPTLSAAALQDEQQLSQLQGVQQDQQQQAAQGQQQLQAAGQQQGYQAASAEQSQRHAQEAHEQKLQHQQEVHEARVAQIRQQANKQPQGGPNGR